MSLAAIIKRAHKLIANRILSGLFIANNNYDVDVDNDA